MNKKSHVHHEKKWATAISLVVSIALMLLKFYAYKLTDSKSILSDALESIVNVIAGTMTLIVVILAAKPRDEDHPYGHGKLESMAASFEGGAIVLAGILIILEATQALFHGIEIRELNLGLGIVIFAGLINGLLGLVLLRRGKRLHSEALKSSGAHLLSDALSSLGIIVGLIVVKFSNWVWIDPAVAILFGAILVVGGIKILVQSGNVLLDAQDTHTIEQLAKHFEKNYRPGVIQIHFARVIRSGNYHHVDCHMVIPEFWTIDQGHQFIHDFEHQTLESYPYDGEFHIHLDPCRKVYCKSCELPNCPIRVMPFEERKSIAFEELLKEEEVV